MVCWPKFSTRLFKTKNLSYLTSHNFFFFNCCYQMTIMIHSTTWEQNLNHLLYYQLILLLLFVGTITCIWRIQQAKATAVNEGGYEKLINPFKSFPSHVSNYCKNTNDQEDQVIEYRGWDRRWRWWYGIYGTGWQQFIVNLKMDSWGQWGRWASKGWKLLI